MPASQFPGTREFHPENSNVSCDQCLRQGLPVRGPGSGRSSSERAQGPAVRTREGQRSLTSRSLTSQDWVRRGLSPRGGGTPSPAQPSGAQRSPRLAWRQKAVAMRHQGALAPTLSCLCDRLPVAPPLSASGPGLPKILPPGSLPPSPPPKQRLCIHLDLKQGVRPAPCPLHICGVRSSPASPVPQPGTPSSHASFQPRSACDCCPQTGDAGGWLPASLVPPPVGQPVRVRTTGSWERAGRLEFLKKLSLQTGNSFQ